MINAAQAALAFVGIFLHDPAGRFRVRVLQKGLLIVSVPVALELAIISTLGCLLLTIDKQYALEANRAGLNLNEARLIFANCRSAADLIQLWRSRDLSAMSTVLEHGTLSDELTGRIAEYVRKEDPETRAGHERVLEIQVQLRRGMNEMAQLAEQGINMDSLRKLFKKERELARHLKDMYEIAEQLKHGGWRSVAEAQAQLEELQKLEFVVVLAGFALNIVAAIWLAAFFRQSFVAPTEIIKQNIAKLAAGEALLPRLNSGDEISDLDAAFHAMSEELKLAGERENALFDNSTDVICLLDERLNFERVNHAASRFWGTPAEKLVGESVASVLSSQDYERLQEACAITAAEGFVLEVERRCTGQSGLLLWSLAWSGEQRRWFGVVHDISDERRVEQKKQAFLRLISVDIRQPLKNVSDLLQSILSEDADSNRGLERKALERIKNTVRTVRRLGSLVDDLLNIEQFKTSEITLSLQQCSITDLLRATVAEMQAFADKREITIACECPEKLEAVCDENALARVIANYLSNAIKYSSDHSSIQLTATAQDRFLRIAVTDHGRGIPAAALSQIFQPFQQVQAEDGRRGAGTGLGLVICKRIAEQHGGSVGVHSLESEGSTFWIEIPIHPNLPSQMPENAGATDIEVKPCLQTKRGKHFLSFARTCQILIGVPLLLETVFVALMLLILNQSAAEWSGAMANRKVAFTAADMTASCIDLAMQTRLNLLQKFDESKCRDSLKLFPERIRKFQEATKANATTMAYAAEAVTLMNMIKPRINGLYEMVIDFHKGLSPIRMRDYSNDALVMAAQLSGPVDKLISYCDARDQVMIRARAASRQQEIVLLLAGCAMSGVTGIGLALFMSRGLCSRLGILAENSRRFTSAMNLAEPLEGDDEIARLDAAFHKTANQLTEMRARERAFLDNSKSIICTVDSEGKFVTVNKTAAKLFESEVSRLIGVPLSTLVTAESEVQKWLQEARNTGMTVKFLSESRFADGRKLHLAWSVSCSSDQLYCIARDVTKQVELERMKREFLSVVGHDVRTPLTSVNAVLMLLKEDLRSAPQVLDKLCCAEQETTKLTNMINDLLDISKWQAGKLELMKEQIYLWSVLRRAVDVANEVAVSNQSVIECPETDAETFADRDRLTQVLSSLLVKAIRSSGKGSKIFIKVEEAHDSLRFEVGSNQLKLDAGETAILQTEDFEANVDSCVGGDSLLDLLVCRAIVAAHGGQIGTVDGNGAGCSLWFEIPRLEPQQTG